MAYGGLTDLIGSVGGRAPARPSTKVWIEVRYRLAPWWLRVLVVFVLSRIVTSAILLAFAGSVAPNAVPTTLVIDKQGRVAARFLGLIDAPSALKTIVTETIAEAD